MVHTLGVFPLLRGLVLATLPASGRALNFEPRRFQAPSAHLRPRKAPWQVDVFHPVSRDVAHGSCDVASSSVRGAIVECSSRKVVCFCCKAEFEEMSAVAKIAVRFRGGCDICAPASWSWTRMACPYAGFTNLPGSDTPCVSSRQGSPICPAVTRHACHRGGVHQSAR